jgi:hypothetical protein
MNMACGSSKEFITLTRTSSVEDVKEWLCERKIDEASVLTFDNFIA